VARNGPCISISERCKCINANSPVIQSSLALFIANLNPIMTADDFAFLLLPSKHVFKTGRVKRAVRCALVPLGFRNNVTLASGRLHRTGPGANAA
jgi:hypothetical protein